MSDKARGILLTLLEIVLCFLAAWLLWMAVSGFFGVIHMAELNPWMVSKGEPYWEDALHVVEEEQWAWGLTGFLFYLCPGILLGSAAAALALWRRGKTRWWALCFLTGSLTLALTFLTMILNGGWAVFWLLILTFALLFLFCFHKARENGKRYGH